MLCFKVVEFVYVYILYGISEKMEKLRIVVKKNTIQVTLGDFMKLKPPTFSGSSASEDPQRFIDGLERL